MLSVVKYEAVWCAACKQAQPAFDKLLAAHPEVNVEYVDVVHDPSRAADNNVRSLPTFIVYEGNEEIGRGSTPAFIEKLMEQP